VGGGTAGVIITSFSPEVPEVYEQSTVLFTTIVKNLGDIPVATGEARVEILGLDDWAPIDPSRKPIAKLIGDRLIGADPTRNLEGGEAVLDFKLRAPQKTNTITYTPVARLTYPYSTKSTIQLKFATKELVRINPNEQSAATITTSSGPLAIAIKGRLPVVEPRPVTFQLEIQNVGGGKVFFRASDSVNIATDVCTPKGDQRLVGGKSRILTCTVTVPADAPVGGFATKTFDVHLSYTYIIDKQTSVTVLKPT
jgi:hypothetical protein